MPTQTQHRKPRGPYTAHPTPLRCALNLVEMVLDYAQAGWSNRRIATATGYSETAVRKIRARHA